MRWHASVYARVLKRLFVAFARLVAMRKGFKGNVHLIPICARVLWKYGTMCGNVQGGDAFFFFVCLLAMCKGFKEMWWLARLCARALRKQRRSCSYVKGF